MTTKDVEGLIARMVDEYRLGEVLHCAIAGSRLYQIPTAADYDFLIVVAGNADYPRIVRDDDSGAHVFIRSAGYLRRLIDGEIDPVLGGPTLSGLSDELCKKVGVDFFGADEERIKRAAGLDFNQTCLSQHLVRQEADGSYVSTRQSKGVYHALALMYKLKNRSFTLTVSQLKHLAEAHDKVLCEELLDEVHEFYADGNH